MKITTVFLDRDGVLNVNKSDYLLHEEDVSIYEDVPAAIKRLTKAGIQIIIVSNQAGIGKELITRRTAEAIFDKVIRGSETKGGHIDDYYYCPHTPDEGCNCRKPGIGMFVRAKLEHDIIMEESVFVGDGFGDAQAAKHLKIPFYLVDQGWGPVTKVKCDAGNIPYIPVKNLRDAVKDIIKRNKG